jgi:iron-sulfur cluster assembly accessory protein
MASTAMPFPRLLQHPVTSSLAVCRARSNSPSRGCIQGLRMFSSQKPTHNSSKRELQTATAYRPHTLSGFPPPRNTGIPETSIAGESAEHNQSGSPHSTRQQDTASSSDVDKNSSVSLNEGEAQKTKPENVPASSTASNSTSQTATKPRRSKLRPRKAAMTITPTATAQLHSLLSQPNPKMIRVGVRNRGCSGLAYHLEYVEKPGTFDEVVEQDGVKVLVDSKALFSIIGSEMDWQEDKLSKRFVFNNPNISKCSSYSF